jgi:hypothetical protein
MDSKVITSGSQMRFMLYLLIALVVADGILTNFLIVHNMGYELNPFLEDIAGGSYLLPVKVVGALLASVMLWKIYQRLPRAAVICSLGFIAVYTAILYWNTFAFLLAL